MIRNAKRALAMIIAAISMATGSLNVMATPVSEFTPDVARDCILDSVNEVQITNGQNNVWFKFTAPEDGTYAFFTSTEQDRDCDPLLLLYNSEIRLINGNDDAGYGESANNSYVSAVLSSGETVYIQATLSDYEIATGIYSLHVTKGVAFYFEYKDEKYYMPWYNSDLCVWGGEKTSFMCSGDITIYISGGTGEMTEYMGGNIVFDTDPDSVIKGSFEVDFSIGVYDFHKSVSIDIWAYQSCRWTGPEEISGVYGDQFVPIMVDPGESVDVTDSTRLVFWGFFGYYYTSGPSTDNQIGYNTYSFENATIENNRRVLHHTFENIDSFILVRLIADDGPTYSEKYYYIYVPDDNAPIMDIDTDYTIDFTHEFLNYSMYRFTPRLTGSYTFNSLNRVDGCPNIAVFTEDNELVGCVRGDYPDPSEDLRRYNYERGVRYYYFHYGNEESRVEEDTRRSIDPSLERTDVEMTLDLEAGQTYWVTVGSDYFTTDLFDIRVTCNENVPYPTASPTPTTAPTDAPTAQPTSSPVIDEPITGPVVPAANYSIGDFVERLYTVALGRPSDPEGKQDWIDAVTLRGQTGADLARGFLYSPEFLQKNVSNEEFVRVLYRTFFNRDADADGLAGWVAVLDNGGSKEGVIEGFINSTEWANLCLLYGVRSGGTGVPNIEVEPNQQTIDFATRLYTTCLGRAADQNGLRAWARQLANQRDTGTGAARGFFFSNEFTGQNVSNDEYVNRLYRTFMGREADEAGFNAWVAQLNEGVSREEVFEGFAQSPEFTGICASYGIIR